jgi:hypothetical protein
MRARKTIVVVLTAAVLAAVGASSASAGSYSDGPLTATFAGPTHHPNCKQKWPVTVTARYHGKPAHATASYQFLVDGDLVGTSYPFSSTSRNPHNRLWHFSGGFTDNTFGPFGALAVGQSITVRAVVKESSYTAYPSYGVTVVTARGCKAVRTA